MDAFKSIQNSTIERNLRNFENVKFYRDMMKNLNSKTHKNLQSQNASIKEKMSDKYSKKLSNYFTLNRLIIRNQRVPS